MWSTKVFATGRASIVTATEQNVKLLKESRKDVDLEFDFSFRPQLFQNVLSQFLCTVFFLKGTFWKKANMECNEK